MIFIAFLIVALCTGELLFDTVLAFAHRLFQPRPRTFRARQYRFN